eukprot:13785950-Ditylum_brightwellii.AAC.1
MERLVQWGRWQLMQTMEHVISMMFFSPVSINATMILKMKKGQRAKAEDTVTVDTSLLWKGMEVHQCMPSLPLLVPVKDLGTKGNEFQTLVERAAMLKEHLSSYQLSTDFTEEEKNLRVEAYVCKIDLLIQDHAIRRKAHSSQTMVMHGELKNIKKVLWQLGHID